MWSLAWLSEYGEHFQVPAVLLYDANSAGMGSFGFWRSVPYPAPAQGPTLPDFAIAMRQLAETVLALTHCHVKGHSGALGNELSDRMASAARAAPSDPYERCQPAWPARLHQHPMWAWAWATRVVTHDLPTIFAMETEADRLRRLPRHTDTAPSFGVRPIRATKEALHYRYTCVSYNVLTLRDDSKAAGVPAGMRITGRRAILLQELAKHSPLLVGLQETRLPESAVSPDARYFMYQSSATDRGHGDVPCGLQRTCHTLFRVSVNFTSGLNMPW